VLESPGGKPLNWLIGAPMEIRRFLQLAVAHSGAVGWLHERGLMHEDIKPAHVLVNFETAQVWLSGFGIASRSLREQQAPESPELIPGTLPAAVGRSIDCRAHLYSLVTMERPAPDSQSNLARLRGTRPRVPTLAHSTWG
jgi:serine/threonine protein kinase